MEKARRIRTTVAIVAMLGVLLALFPLVPGGSVAAQSGEKRAGLVLQFADGSTKTYCVAFAEESISGLDLLLKTGLDVRVESFGGAGALICKIGPDGCDFPEEPCVCQSYGPGGVYWSYHHLKEGRWVASGVSVSKYVLRDGDVDGLAWSAGKPPPLFAFSQVCSAAQVEPSTEAQPTATRRPPSPAPTRPPPTFTPRSPRPEATREPTLPPSISRPSTTATPKSSIRATSTAQRTPVFATATSTVRFATATIMPTSTPSPTDSPTLGPTETVTSQPTTPIPASTDTAVPTRAAVTATPVLAVIDARSDTGEGTARNIALSIGVVTLAGLVGWGIWRGRRKRGSNVG